MSEISKVVVQNLGPEAAAHRHITADGTMLKGLDANVAGCAGPGVFVVACHGKPKTDSQVMALKHCLAELKNAFPDAKIEDQTQPAKQPSKSEGQNDAATVDKKQP